MVSNKRLNIKEVLEKVEKKKLTFFTLDTFAKTFNTSISRATVFLSNNTHQGYFVRLKKGVYGPTILQPSSFEIANIVYKPSYISLELALSFYHIFPETVYSITSITPKHSKQIQLLNQIFAYHKLNKKLYFGYHTLKINNSPVFIATKEKAFLDYLYFVARGQKKYNDRLDTRYLDKKIVSEYSKIFFTNIKNKYIKQRFEELLRKVE